MEAGGGGGEAGAGDCYIVRGAIHLDIFISHRVNERTQECMMATKKNLMYDGHQKKFKYLCGLTYFVKSQC